MIDASIPLQVQAPQFDPVGAVARGISLKNLLEERQLQQAKMNALQQEQNSRASLSSLFANPNFDMNSEQGIRQIAQHDPEMAMKLSDRMTSRAKQQKESQAQQMKNKTDIAGDIMKAWDSQGRDPGAFDIIKQQYAPIVQSLDTGVTPEEYAQATPGMFEALARHGGYRPIQERLEEIKAVKGAEAEAAIPAKQSIETFKYNLSAPERAAAASDRNAAAQERNQLTREKLDMQRSQYQDKQAKLESDRQDALANIDDTISEFNTLKDIQDKTMTGPVSGSKPMVAIRKMLPNSIGGGENLQRLEKGYNTLAVKAIGAFKAGGVTFGQLSNKEGEWIRSTQAALDTGGEINKEMLENGIKLLQDRRKRLESRGALNMNAGTDAGRTFTGPDGKTYRIIGGDPNNPDIELVR